MGFSGDFVLARGDRSLLELPQFGAGVACDEGHADCVHSCSARPGGWQTLQIHHGLPGGGIRAGLRELVGTTDAPAMIARVMDSDVCQVWGLAPSGTAWTTFLDPEMAAGYDIPIPGEDEVPATVELITSWAAEADFTADRHTLLTVLTKRADPFVEDLFFELIDACGLPPAEPS